MARGQKTGGRTAGTPNRTTKELKEWVSDLLNANRTQIKRDLKAVEPEKRLQVLERLMAYVLPKQQAIQAHIDFNNLTDEQLDLIIQHLEKEK